jgi:hypothetical protein
MLGRAAGLLDSMALTCTQPRRQQQRKVNNVLGWQHTSHAGFCSVSASSLPHNVHLLVLTDADVRVQSSIYQLYTPAFQTCHLK